VLARFIAATIEMPPESAVPPTNSSSTISVMSGRLEFTRT
jgi:hypothetical protein